MSKGSDGGVVSPIVVQFRDVTAAAYRIKKGVKETPLEVFMNCQFQPVFLAAHFIPSMQKSQQMSEQLGMTVFFKKEFRMPTGR